MLHRKLTTLAATVATAGLLAVPAVAAAAPGNGNGNGAGGVTGAAFYVDGDLYRTVGTPTDLTGTGAPDHSFDTIYGIAGQPNVATAAPGDDGYNGGRWRVQPLAIADYDATVAAVDSNGSGDLDTTAEVQAALAGGYAVSAGEGPSFVCPVIPLP